MKNNKEIKFEDVFNEEKRASIQSLIEEYKKLNNITHLQEGWVKFTRVHCKEGFIDIWTGDAYHNPNDKIENRWCVNSFTVYLRLDGEGQWVESNTKSVRKYIEDYKEDYSAEEIFKTLTNYETHSYREY